MKQKIKANAGYFAAMFFFVLVLGLLLAAIGQDDEPATTSNAVQYICASGACAVYEVRLAEFR